MNTNCNCSQNGFGCTIDTSWDTTMLLIGMLMEYTDLYKTHPDDYSFEYLVFDLEKSFQTAIQREKWCDVERMLCYLADADICIDRYSQFVDEYFPANLKGCQDRYKEAPEACDIHEDDYQTNDKDFCKSELTDILSVGESLFIKQAATSLWYNGKLTREVLMPSQ
tara:strand:- start:151 stop:648 length:498 start_codon:yes stop_codon:yes gene_type:complete